MSATLAVTITLDGDRPPRVTPARILVDVTDFGLDHQDAPGHLRVRADPGWRVEAVGPRQWSVTPSRVNPDQQASVTLSNVGARRTPSRLPIHVRLDLRNGLDIARHALPLANRASALGEVSPSREVFERTFHPLPEPLNRLLFEGLYADIVYLRLESPRGGLCSGMAHWTIERGLGREPDPVSSSAAVERITMFHGRQLRDRALLGSLPWFLRGSSRAAFRAVRGDLLRQGWTDRAIDVDIPKLWRRDIATAIVAEGHVVVPCHLRQDGLSHGAIEVYDPNAPEALGSDEPRTIRFDLARDRYAYVHRVSLDDTNVGMIAVRQRAYSGRGTAFIALLGSFVLNPPRALRSLLREQQNART
ncbi:MAG TPA: hypothetical protein VMM78_07495 [Thermomicrobiales bacterium]|nr:hypothetical protein [Thermomicrobiales bacterium]